MSLLSLPTRSQPRNPILPVGRDWGQIGCEFIQFAESGVSHNGTHWRIDRAKM